MAVRASLVMLGVKVLTLDDVVDGVNALLIPKEQKLSLLARYEREESVSIPAELYARIN